MVFLHAFLPFDSLHTEGRHKHNETFSLTQPEPEKERHTNTKHTHITYVRTYKRSNKRFKHAGRDPFWWNATTAAKTHAIELSPCASGWCGKAIEGKDGDHLQATERICLQRPPSDNEERCSETFYENKRTPIFMCFCRGDLCNDAPDVRMSDRLMVLIFTFLPALLVFR